MANKKIQLKDKDGNNLYPALVKQCILDIVYPIGSVYISIKNTNPGTLFGGTWTQLKNAYMFATNATSGDKGTGSGTGTGAKSHVLTVNEIPSHNHGDLNWSSDTYHTSIDSGSASGLFIDTKNGILHTTGKWRTGYTGGGKGHTHDVAYLEFYVWKRTA